MALDFGRGLFGDRRFVEGQSPDDVDIGFPGELTENISKGLAITTYTLNHTQVGSILNMSDDDQTTSLELKDLTSDGTVFTTTIILDLGKEVFVHNTIINFTIANSGIAVTKSELTTSHSKDNVSFTQIGQDDLTSITSTDFDHFLTKTKYRYLKLVYVGYHTSGTARVKINSVQLVR